MESESEYTIHQAAQELNAPTREIRSFCTKGLVPNVKHRAAGRRVFTAEQVEWLRVLLRLHHGGMTIPQLKRYAALCRKGNSTIAERKAMLETEKRQLWRTVEEAQATISLIERKIEVFDEVLEKGRELSEEFF